MARNAQESVSSGKAAKPPISTHRAFPFIVALWFAALLGMGSLVVPVEVVEQLVVASGLSSIVPATAPPLGFTARALIALVFTLGGAATGMFIARQVAKAHKGELGTSGRRPISAHDELGDEGFDGNARRGRRALAIEEDYSPSEFLDFAPLPGAENIEFEMPEGTQAEAETAATSDAPVSTDGDFEAYDLTEADTGVSAYEEADEVMPGFASLHDDAGDDDLADRQEFLPADDQAFDDAWVEDGQSGGANQFASAAAAFDDDADDVDAPPFARPPAADDFAEPVTPRQDFMPIEEYETSAPAEEMSVMEDETPAAERESAYAGESHSAEWADASLEKLGLVQLAQRLGSSIEKRRAQRKARAELAASSMHQPRAVPAAIDMAEETDAAQATAAYFGRPSQQEPAAEAFPEAHLQDEADPFAAFGQADAAEEVADEYDMAQQPAEEPADVVVSRASQIPVAERQVFQPLPDDEFTKPAKYQPLEGFAALAIEEDDEEEQDDFAASFSLPLGRMADTARFETDAEPVEAGVDAFFAENDAPADDEAEDLEDDTAGGDFGSLAGLNPFKTRPDAPVRIEDEPEDEDGIVEAAVVFPSEARGFAGPATQTQASNETASKQDTEENDRALREALLSLQRMSGAG